MSKYEPRITQDGTGEFYALVVRVDYDGSENVCHGFSGYYKTKKSALRYANQFIAKRC